LPQTVALDAHRLARVIWDILGSHGRPMPGRAMSLIDGTMPVARFADAIVLAAGGSQRMNGFDKLWTVVHGRPLIAWTVAGVAAADTVRNVILVVRPDQVSSIQQEPWVIEARATVVAGGERRQESVADGVEASDAEVVVIHDGARPLATPALVDAVALAAAEFGVGLPLVPLAESLRRLRRTSIVDWIDRFGLNLAQTPQGIRRQLLLDAYAIHDPWGSESIIDETLLVQMGGASVTAVPGERANLKVTVAEDLEIVSAILAARSLDPRVVAVVEEPA
jgi:2-C-methyl-D-erythritol 4-phosphate cytidylyltransferase